MGAAALPGQKYVRLIGAAPLVAIAVAASICGGCGAVADHAGSRPNGGLSQAELVSGADIICRTAARESQAIAVPANVASQPQASAAYIVDTSTAITERETRELQRLMPAPEAAAAWRTFITAQVAGLQVARLLKEKVDAGDPRSTTVLPRAAVAAAAIAKAAKEVGAAACVPRDEQLVAH